MDFGYIRVSTTAQNIDRQIDELKNAGVEVENLFIDKITGTKANRPALNDMFNKLRAGDKVIVTELARFSRSTKDLLSLIERLDKLGVEFKCIKDNIDTSTPQGKCFFTIACAFAQLERDIIVERTKQGLASARARGRNGGRPPKDKESIDNALKLYDRKFTLTEIEKITGISRPTIYKYLKLRKEKR